MHIVSAASQAHAQNTRKLCNNKIIIIALAVFPLQVPLFTNIATKIGRFIREGDTASVIGVLKKHHACDIVDVPPGVVTTGCQPMRFMFPILMEGLILIGNEDPDEAVYMV